MECHNPLNRGVQSARRAEGGGFRSKANKDDNDLIPDMKYQPPFSRSGGNRNDIPRSRSEQFSSSRSSSERSFFSDTKKPLRGDYPTPSRSREERSAGIFARETDRSRFPPKPPRPLEFITPKEKVQEKVQEKEEELEPWEIERAKNRANRLNWSLSRTNGSSTPTSSSTSASSTTTSSTSTPSPTSTAENNLCASMAQLKTDDSPVVLHGQLAKLPTPSTLPSVTPGSGRRYIDPERQAEIDAQFGMSAEVDTSHMLELYELDTVDPDLLLPMLGPHVEGLYQISQNQCVVIFDNKSHAQELLRKNRFVAGRIQALHPLRLQQYSHLLPKKFRPETTTKLARRIIFHNLSIRTERTPEDKARRETKTPQSKVDTSAWE